MALPNDNFFDYSKVHGRGVVITGGCSGIGEAATRAFIAAGAFVVLGDLDICQGAQLVSELGHDKLVVVKCDVRSWEDQLNLFQIAISWLPHQCIDVVVANAGLFRKDDLCYNHVSAELPAKPDLSIIETNIIGVLFTIRLAMHYFNCQCDRTKHDRCLLMTSSVAGYIDIPDAPQYAASKCAIRALLHTFRHTEREIGIRVNTIAPFFIATRMLPEDFVCRLKSANILLADVEDAAQALLHLAADTSINGRTLFIVHRSVCPRGYMDLAVDDHQTNELLQAWQLQALQISAAGQ